METKELIEWTENKIGGLKKLIEWYEGLPEGTEVLIDSIREKIPVSSVLLWLSACTSSGSYTTTEQRILNDLLQVRKEWLHDYIGV